MLFNKIYINLYCYNYLPLRIVPYNAKNNAMSDYTNKSAN